MTMAQETNLDHFKTVVEFVFNKWTALRLAIEHGMGGATGYQTALEMVEYFSKYSADPGVDASDIAAALEDIMDQEFDTTCEDNSPIEIGHAFKQYFTLCQNGQFNELQIELAKLPEGPLWLKQGCLNRPVPADDSSDESVMEEESVPTASTSGSTTTMVVEEVDPEWTTVKTRKKKH